MRKSNDPPTRRDRVRCLGNGFGCFLDNRCHGTQIPARQMRLAQAVKTACPIAT